MDLPSDNLTTAPEQRGSELFSNPTADITFISSDYVLFKLHGNYINLSSAWFAIPENNMVGLEPVQLSEPSKTLEILFQFIEPPSELRNYRQPSVLDMEPDLLFAVAEAAEKYVVYGAMNICITRMQQLVSERPLDVLNHCVKHGYTDLADQAAEKSLSQPLNMVALKLTAPGRLAKWLVYYDSWRKLGKRVLKSLEKYLPFSACPVMARIYFLYLHQISQNPSSVLTTPSLPENYTIKCGIPPSKSCLCQAIREDPQFFDKMFSKDIKIRIQSFSAITV